MFRGSVRRSRILRRRGDRGANAAKEDDRLLGRRSAFRRRVSENHGGSYPERSNYNTRMPAGPGRQSSGLDAVPERRRQIPRRHLSLEPCRRWVRIAGARSRYADHPEVVRAKVTGQGNVDGVLGLAGVIFRWLYHNGDTVDRKEGRVGARSYSVGRVLAVKGRVLRGDVPIVLEAAIPTSMDVSSRTLYQGPIFQPLESAVGEQSFHGPLVRILDQDRVDSVLGSGDPILQLKAGAGQLAQIPLCLVRHEDSGKFR